MDPVLPTAMMDWHHEVGTIVGSREVKHVELEVAKSVEADGIQG